MYDYCIVFLKQNVSKYKRVPIFWVFTNILFEIFRKKAILLKFSSLVDLVGARDFFMC